MKDKVLANQNFQKINKLGYRYVLTPKGIAKKTELTINFMKKIEKYDKILKLTINKCGQFLKFKKKSIIIKKSYIIN